MYTASHLFWGHELEIFCGSYICMCLFIPMMVKCFCLVVRHDFLNTSKMQNKSFSLIVHCRSQIVNKRLEALLWSRKANTSDWSMTNNLSQMTQLNLFKCHATFIFHVWFQFSRGVQYSQHKISLIKRNHHGKMSYGQIICVWENFLMFTETYNIFIPKTLSAKGCVA